jgi:hypothetical protein
MASYLIIHFVLGLWCTYLCKDRFSLNELVSPVIHDWFFYAFLITYFKGQSDQHTSHSIWPIHARNTYLKGCRRIANKSLELISTYSIILCHKHSVHSTLIMEKEIGERNRMENLLKQIHVQVVFTVLVKYRIILFRGTRLSAIQSLCMHWCSFGFILQCWILTLQHQMVGWQMNWKGFGRKQSSV